MIDRIFKVLFKIAYLLCGAAILTFAIMSWQTHEISWLAAFIWAILAAYLYSCWEEAMHEANDNAYIAGSLTAILTHILRMLEEEYDDQEEPEGPEVAKEETVVE
ncbi:hypothetical protein QP139_01550 [Winkia sp. UMB10116]|uniref:hypothetical protein n=2 Tax=Bacillati TaxID=1783272 RepID=UPI002555C6F9|nr:hypothetical protein [Winkia sp. UMB10116]MDK6240184.1 hypothetical protein [Winkia sp. UMB10116]